MLIRHCLFLPLLLPMVAFTAGCLTTQASLAERDMVIDSLYAVERGLRQEIAALQDSLLFYDDIDTGRYYRTLRALRDRINQLEYEQEEGRPAHSLVEIFLVHELFESASATLTAAGKRRLDTLVDPFEQVYAGHRIRVEAHADNLPVGGSLLEIYPSNWELSAGRAAAIVRYFIDAHGMDPARFDVVSAGDARPAASNDTPAGRRLNRRILFFTSLD